MIKQNIRKQPNLEYGPFSKTTVLTLQKVIVFGKKKKKEDAIPLF